MKKTSIALMFSFLSLAAMAQEGNLQTPMDFETTKVLPKGVRNLRYRGAYIQANDKYDDSGNQVPVGNALNKSVTWNTIIDGKDSAQERAQLRGFLLANGINPDDEVGQTAGIVNIAVDARVPIIAYGVTPKLTSALAIPYISTHVRTGTGSMANSNLSNFAQSALADNGAQEKALDLQMRFADAINEKLRKYGYDELSEDRKNHIGDMRLVNKYLFAQETKYSLALRQDLVMPTGAPTSTSKAVDVASGDGQWDVGAGLIGDYFVTDNIQFTAYAGYLAQLPTTLARRIPEKSDSKLTPDIDSNTRMDLGDQIRTQLASKFFFLNGFSTLLGYTYQYREADKYTGGQYNAERYAWMSQNTEQNMHAGQIGIGYSTVPMFQKKQFPVPLEANLYHTRVMGGKNVVNDPLTAFEFAMFF